jgi:hypothetical protein
MLVIFAGIAEFTASGAKACHISGLYSRKKPQFGAFNNYFMQEVNFANNRTGRQPVLAKMPAVIKAE